MKPQFAAGVLLFFCILTIHSFAPAMEPVYDARIDKVYPETIGNKGKVTVNVIGRLKTDDGHNYTCSPKFYSYGQLYDLDGTVVKVADKAYVLPNDPTSTPLDVVTVTFDFSEGIQAGYGGGWLGLFDCNSTDPNTVSYNVAVQESTNQDLWVDISGLTTVRFGAKTDYTIIYGNSGSTNVDAAVLYIAVPKHKEDGDPQHTLGFNLADYALAPYNPAGLNWGTITQQMDVDIDQDNYTVYQLMLRDIPPFSFNPLKVTITWGNKSNNYRLKVWWGGGSAVTFDPIPLPAT